MSDKIYASEIPTLLAEWNWDKNNDIGLHPNELLLGSNKKAWWKCEKGHEWLASIYHRAVRNHGCPYCSGRLAVSGETDLATLNPKLAQEWHPTKNGNLTPNQLTIRSGKKVWWLCSNGHEWQATPHDRDTDGTNCPYCSARRQTSFPEQAIYYYIKKIFPNSINRYKDIFSNSMELDIYIPDKHIGIEYDGRNWHKTEEEHNRERKKYDICKRQKIVLIRIKENCLSDWLDVADKIYYVDKKRNYLQLNQVINSLIEFIFSIMPKGTKNEYLNTVAIDVIRDRQKIQNYLTNTENSLGMLRPDLVKEWNTERNGNLTPTMFSLHSNESVWWKCSKCGHEWKSQINHRTKENGSGCAICGNIKKGKSFHKGYLAINGSLAQNNPELAKEWHTTRNIDLTPNDVTAASPIRVWWKCSKCGHEWQASPNNRSKDVGCPCCSGRVPKIGVNDLATVNPSLASEWLITKNAPLTPNIFLPNSGKKVWWKCSKCSYEWQATIVSRNKGHGCPCCSGRVPKIGENDLATINPNLASEWFVEKNAPLMPNMVLPNSGKKVWWKCSKCGHEWQAVVSSRSNGRSCPNCYKMKLTNNKKQ
ncbi:MAG: zinc-ribbon domain-containing protein [Christensenellales bacterium]